MPRKGNCIENAETWLPYFTAHISVPSLKGCNLKEMAWAVTQIEIIMYLSHSLTVLVPVFSVNEMSESV